MPTCRTSGSVPRPVRDVDGDGRRPDGREPGSAGERALIIRVVVVIDTVARGSAAASSPSLRILQYDWRMSATTRITVTLPSDQVAELRKITKNVSGYVAEAVARQIRHKLLVDELERYQRESGAFTEEELTEARARIFGDADRTEDTAA